MKTRYKKCPRCKDGVCKTCKGAGKLKIINGRGKGCGYERKIAKLISEWTGFNMQRTPMSGGWAKTGDITPKDPSDMVKFIFNMELKKHKGWDFNQLIKTRGKGTIDTWWKQCTDDATKSGKIPLLIMSKNNDTDYCMMYEYQFRTIIGMFSDKPTMFHLRMFDKTIFLLEDLLKLDYLKISKI